MKYRTALIFIASSLFLFVLLLSFSSKTNAQTGVPADLISSGFTFQKSLKIGDMVYPDVNYLQYFLDQDVINTVVANSGPGSANNTTSFFGNKTADAVSRFQTLYASEVLAPAGLMIPTGYFGKLSMAKVNNILASMRNSAGSSSQSNISSGTSYSSVKPYAQSIAQPTPYANNASIPTYTPSTGYSFTAQDNYIIDRVSTKVDSQMVGISDNSVKQTIKSGIMAKLKSEIIKSKFQASLKAVGLTVASPDDKIDMNLSHNVAQESSWKRVTNFLQEAIVGGVAYAAGLPDSFNNGTNPILAQASETSFGGMYLFFIQCTCGSDSLNYINDYKTNNMLALLYEQGQSKLFLNNNIYGKYQLGTYSQATYNCQIEAGDDCVDVKTDGIYGSMPGTGTSN